MPRAASPLSLSRLLRRFTLLLMAIGAATLLASGSLTESTLRSAQREAFTARFDLLAQRAATAAENALALGVPLAPDTPLGDLLEREAALEPALRAFAIQSAQGADLLSAPGVAGAPGDEIVEARAPIHNDLGETIGAALLRYDSRALGAAQRRLAEQVWRAVAPAMGLWCVAMALLCAALARRVHRHAPPLRVPGGERTVLSVGAALGLCLALAAVGAQALQAGQASLQPDQLAKARAVARSSAALIGKALAVGVPLTALEGVSAHAAALHAQSPEITALALRTPGGDWLAGSAPPSGAWVVTAPVRPSGELAGDPVAEVVLTLDPGVLTRRLMGTLLDMAFLGAVCLLMAQEALALGLGTRGARALVAGEARRGRLAGRPQPRPASGVSAVRPALFLFMLAEELTRPFLPTWGRSLAPAVGGLNPAELASLPLVVFLAVVALLQWPLAGWSERFGRRRGLVLGALLGAVGLAVAAAWASFAALLGGRLLGAVGFAMVFVSAQGAVIDGSSVRDRARSLALFVRAILVAGLCGPPLGGLAAQRWGAPAAFALAAGVALLAALVAWVQLPRDRVAVAAPAAAVAPGSASSWRRLWRQPGLAALLLGCALPAKLLLAALCFYLLPLHVEDLGLGSAVTGRLQTLYPLTMVLLVPLAARLADRWGRRSRFVVIGGVVAGASALWAAQADGVWLLALVLLGLGAGQALSITPQSALVADLAHRLPGRQGAAVLGLFRLTERGGSALGPVLAAALMPALGFGAVVAAIGALVIGGSLAYGWHQRERRTGWVGNHL